MISIRLPRVVFFTYLSLKKKKKKIVELNLRKKGKESTRVRESQVQGQVIKGHFAYNLGINNIFVPHRRRRNRNTHILRLKLFSYAQV